MISTMYEGMGNLHYAKGIVAQWNADGTNGRAVEICAYFRSRIPHKKLFLICQLAMCLPGTNAPVEWIFSIINNTIQYTHTLWQPAP